MSDLPPDNLAPGPDSGELSPIKDSETATPAYLARLIFLSYRFSQGGIGTQNRLLLHLEDNYYPNLFDPETLSDVAVETEALVGGFFLNEKAHPSTAVPWEEEYPGNFKKSSELVSNELAGLFDRFTNRDQLNLFDFDAASIAMSVLAMDIDYLKRPGGRGGNSEDLKIKVGPFARDPFDSTFIRYGILQTPTRTPEYDQIFALISSTETIRQFDELTLKHLQTVIEIYIREHPDEAIDDRLIQISDLCEELLRG